MSSTSTIPRGGTQCVGDDRPGEQREVPAGGDAFGGPADHDDRIREGQHCPKRRPMRIYFAWPARSRDKVGPFRHFESQNPRWCVFEEFAARDWSAPAPRSSFGEEESAGCSISASGFRGASPAYPGIRVGPAMGHADGVLFASIRGSHNLRVNAAEGSVPASHADDIVAAEAKLAPDFVMLNLGSDGLVVVRESIAGALRAGDFARDEFAMPTCSWAPSAARIHCAGGSLRREPAIQRCVGLISSKSISRWTSSASRCWVRPLGGLMAPSARMSGGR